MSRMHFAGNSLPTEKDLAELAEYTTSMQAPYRAALNAMDWLFAYSDDGRAFKEGAAKLAALREMQPVFDPDGAIWDSIAPYADGVDIPTPRRS